MFLSLCLGLGRAMQSIFQIFSAIMFCALENLVAKFYVEKADPSMTGYAVSAAIKNNSDYKVIRINAKAAGAATPRQAEVTLSYKKEVESNTVFAKLESSTVTTGIWTTLTTREGSKTLETFV